MKKKAITEETIERFEAETGVKIISIEDEIIEYEGERWRPIRSLAEFLCICFDNEPILKIQETSWVSIDYHP